MIPGGQDNRAKGNRSFAAGRRAKADHDGTFVWADGTDADFASTGVQQFLIRAGGGVGIGTTSPGAQLDVVTNMRVSRSPASTQYIQFLDNSSGGWLESKSPENNKKPLLLQAVHDGSGGASGENYIRLSVGAASGPVHAMVIKESGNVGIGTSTPAEKLQVNGNICYTGSIASCSDARYKREVATIPNSLDKVTQMRGVHYKWKQDEFPELDFDDKAHLGFIAQDVEALFPEMVLTDDNGYKSVDYSRLTPVLVEAIKEQQQMLTSQQAELDELRAMIEMLVSGR
jgi:hypothetical protein